jgi:hypothetical protein
VAAWLVMGEDLASILWGLGRCLPDLDWSGVVGCEIVFGYMSGGFGKSVCYGH